MRRPRAPSACSSCRLGKEVGEPELQELLEALDIRQHGVIEYDEFLAACLEEQHLTETRLRAAFDYFDHDGTGLITEQDVVQVLKDVGLDETIQADDLMAAAGGTSTAPGSAAGSEQGSVSADGRGSPSLVSSRSISYEDFRRVLLNQPPSIITRALGQPNSPGSGMLEVSSPPAAALGPAQLPEAAAATPLLETVLQSITRSSSSPDTAQAVGTALAGRPSPSTGTTTGSPTSGRPPRRAAAPGASGSRHVLLLPPDNDFEPLSYSDVEESPRLPTNSYRPGPEPPSPISLLPRYEPPSPADPRRQSPRQPNPFGLMQAYNPTSPISLLPKQEPPSPAAAQQGVASPPVQPYSAYGRTMGSPMISLAPRHKPPSPMLGSRHGSSTSSPLNGSADGSGMTLQQILQQYSSSGYAWPGSRRGSMDTARGTPRGGNVQRGSQFSDVSESWLGDN